MLGGGGADGKDARVQPPPTPRPTVPAQPAIFNMLSTRDVRHLRRADKALRSLVAEHPWADSITPVSHLLSEWRSSFPAAIACHLKSPTLTKGQLEQLKGVNSFSSSGFRSKAEANEQPLAVVRAMPHLEALSVANVSAPRRANRWSGAALPLLIAPSAAVWGELGRLRELCLELPASAMPVALLGSLNGSLLRKLAIRNSTLHSADGIQGMISDAALAALPLLEELLLNNVLPSHAGIWGSKGPSPDFTGSCLAALPRLKVLAILSASLPSGVFSRAPASLRSLDVSWCSGLTDASFAAPFLAGITSLTLRNPPAAMTSAAFAGLTALEELVMQIVGDSALASDGAFAVLGSHCRLRRLRFKTNVEHHGAGTAPGAHLHALARCPLEEMRSISLARETAACPPAAPCMVRSPRRAPCASVAMGTQRACCRAW